MIMAVFWDVAPCSLVDTDRSLRETYCLHRKGAATESSSETSVNIYQTTRCNIPEDSHLQGRLASQFVVSHDSPVDSYGKCSEIMNDLL
jgi:hypothetical protein